MHLTQFSDYSIRVLIYLAVKGEQRSTINEIADAFGISRHHLIKVVQGLRQRDYVTAVRGKHGGLLLTRDPSTIMLGKLICETEPSMALVECFRGDDLCRISSACWLKPILNTALSAFLEVLNGYTLADLVEQRHTQLATLMQINTTELRIAGSESQE